ncbi:MAG: hypothetical protein AAFU64_14510 [Bacteroidota bacterium]
MLKQLLFGLFCLIIFEGCAQAPPQDYLGNWDGQLTDPKSFSFTIRLEEMGSKAYQFTLANANILIDQKVKSTTADYIQFDLHFRP